MHLDIKKMKNLSTKALNDGLQFFIDLLSGEERKAFFALNFLVPEMLKKVFYARHSLFDNIGGFCAK